MGMLVLSLVVYLIVRYNVIGYLLNVGKEVDDLLNNPFVGMSLGEKYATISYTLLEYLRLLVFPHPLTHDYYPYHIPIMNWGKPGSILGLVFYLGMGLFGLWGIYKKNFYAFCIWAFLAPLSVVSNIFFSVGTFMNERFIYMSSLGFVLALAYFGTRHFPKLSGKAKEQFQLIPAILLGLFLMGFSVKTALRVPVWKNKLSLNEAGVAVSKNSVRVNCFIATALFEDYQKYPDTERDIKLAMLERAGGYLDHSLSMHPTYKNSLMMKAGVLAEIFRFDREAKSLLDGFFNIRKIRPIDYIDTYLEYMNNKGLAVDELLLFYHKLGFEELAERQKNIQAGLKYLNYGYKAYPKDFQICKDLCIVHGFAKNPQASIRFGEEALVIKPNDAEVMYHLGVSYQEMGNNAKGQEYLNRAKEQGVTQ